MKPLSVFVLISLTTLFIVTSSLEAAAQDHPLISRYPGTEIHSQWVDEYVEYNIPTKAYVKPNVLAGKITRNGKVTHTLYRAPGSLSGLRAHKNFTSSLAKDGFEILFECVGTACGDGEFIEDLHGGPNKMIWVNERGSSSDAEKYFSVISAKKAETHKEYYVVLYINNRRSKSGFKMLLDILETEEVGDGLVTVSTDFDEIENNGKAILGGLYFDTGKASLLKSSNESLAEIANFLSKDPQKVFLVVGHTDSMGSYQSNLTLSQKRAESVVNSLTSNYSVSSKQLIPVGVSFAAPIASNRQNEGRSKNRRVELVEKP